MTTFTLFGIYVDGEGTFMVDVKAPTAADAIQALFDGEADIDLSALDLMEIVLVVRAYTHIEEPLPYRTRPTPEQIAAWRDKQDAKEYKGKEGS